MRFYFLLFFLAIVLNIFCQNENNIWYFPPKTKVDFNSGNPIVTVVNNKMNNALAGHSIICDKEGKLLFYTSGSNIFDINHQVIAGSEPIFGETNNSIQGALVIKSKDSGKYYLFSLNDMKEESRGELILRTIQINDKDIPFVLPNSTNKIGEGYLTSMIAIKHPCGGHWIIVHERNNNNFVAIHFYEGKVYSTIKSAIGKVPEHRMSSFAFSHSLAVLVAQYWANTAEVFKFDMHSGALSDMILFKELSNISGNFSPNGKYFYAFDGNYSRGLAIRQFDFTEYDSQKIKSSIISLPLVRSMWDDTINTLGVSSIMPGPYNKLYFSAAGQIFSRGTIHNPDVRGVGCNFEPRSIVSPVMFSSRQIPTPLVQANPRIENFLPNDTTSCTINTFNLSPLISYDSLRWYNGSKNREIAISNAGVYSLELYRNGCVYTDTFTYKTTASVKSRSVYLCSNEKYTYKSKSYPVGSTILDTIKGGICDTILSINVESKPGIIVKDSLYICKGSTYEHADGRSYKAGDFILTAKRGFGGDCDTTLFIFINSYKSPSAINVLGNTLVCHGDSSEISGPPGFLKYEWSNGTVASKVLLSKGNHTLTLTDSNACKTTTAFTISELPVWTIQLDQVLKIYQGQDTSISINGEANRIKNYKITPANTGIEVVGAELNIKGQTSKQEIFVTFIDSLGCNVELPITVEVIAENGKIILPNVIIRNARNPVNENFKLQLDTNTEITSLTIFDRWGNKVFQTTNAQDTWDTHKLISDTYIYRIEARSKSGKMKVQVGTIMIAD